VHGVRVGGAVDSNGLHIHFLRSFHNAACYLATISNQQLVNRSSKVSTLHVAGVVKAFV
jgi:hypothetical protein